MTQIRYILIGVVFLACCGCSDSFDASYATLDDARRAGAISRGWIPECLPSSSREIREHHDIDINHGWMRFGFEPADSVVFLHAIRRVPDDSIRFLQLAIPSVPWWNSSLSPGRLPEASNERGFLFFTLRYEETNEAGTVFTTDWRFALKLSEGVGYGWVTTAIRLKAAGA